MRFVCPVDLHFNPTLYICDHPEVAGCANFQRNKEEICDTELPTESPTTSPEKPNNQVCPATGNAFLPHLKDCNKYYQCVNGIKFEFSCAPDLHFSATGLTCVWPELAGCNLVKGGEFGVVTKGIESQTMEEWNSPIMDDPDCLKEEALFIQNRKDCSQYFQCVDGNKYEFTCPPNLHFNPAIDACDYPEFARCEGSDITDTK